MSSIRRADLPALLARFPADVRLLLFAGPDESVSLALAREAVAALCDAADPMAVTSLSAQQLKTDPGLLADEAAAISMFGGGRVIRVDAAGEEVVDAIGLLFSIPAAGNPVVMTAGDLGKASGLRKLADASPLARLLLSYPMDARAVRQWLDARARELGLVLAPGVADRLALAVGHDIGILGQELEKFATFLDAGPETARRLEPEHLAALGAGAGEEDMFQLLAAIMAGNGEAVARQMALLPGGNAIGVLRSLARRLMQMQDLRAAVDAGASAEMAVKALRPPVFWREQQELAGAAGRWPQPRIARALAAVLAAEAAIKAPGSAGDVLGLQAVAMIAAGGGRGASGTGVGAAPRRA